MLAVLVLGALVITGCTGGVAQGWAGGVVSDGTLFVASMKGKLIAIDATGSQLKAIGTSVKMTVTSASGAFSCIPSCSSQSTGSVIYASPLVSDAADPDTKTTYQVVYVADASNEKIYAYTLTATTTTTTTTTTTAATTTTTTSPSVTTINKTWSKDPEWIYPRQGALNGTIIGDMVLDNNTIYFATSDGTVYALSAKDLSLKWSHKIDSKIWSAPAVDGSTLYIGCFNKVLYALNTADGAEKWTYKTDGSINSTPVVDNNTVYFGDYSRHFYAVDTATGNQVWKFPTDDTAAGNPQNFFWAKPVALNGVIYAANLDGNVYALNSSTGNLLNTFTLGDSISSSPVVVGNNIIVATSVASYAPTKQQGKIFLINTTDNTKTLLSILPADEAINAPLFSDGKTVYVHTTKDNLFEIDIATGNFKHPKPFSLVSELYPN